MAILNFSDVLHNVGLDPKKVKLIRHALSDPGFRACYDVGMTLEYTKHQGMGFSKGYDYWVIFISDSGTYARLHSCCRVNGSEPDTLTSARSDCPNVKQKVTEEMTPSSIWSMWIC